MTVRIDIPADPQLVDETGYVLTFVDGTTARPGELVISGDEVDPALARVVDVSGESPVQVHLEFIASAHRVAQLLRDANVAAPL